MPPVVSRPQPDPDTDPRPRDVFRAEIRVPEAEGLRGEPTADELKAINKLATRRLDSAEVFVFDCTPSNNQLDAYYTRMAKSSLRNYAKDAKTGVALMNSHRTGWMFGLELPIGRSFRGDLTEAGDQLTFSSSAYMLRDVKISDVANNDLIAAIEAGTVFDISIGFRGGWFKCGLDGKDMFASDCPHFPGWPADDGEIAWAWVEDAHLGEYSLVYDGATPGAVITKATRLAAEGRLSPGDIVLAEERLGARIRPISVFPVQRVVTELAAVDTDPATAPTEGTDDMTGAETIAAVLGGQSTALTPELRQRLEGLQQQLTTANGTAADALTAVLELAPAAAASSENSAALTELQQRLVTMEAEAADGRAYRTQLISDTLAWGVRGHGDDFRRELWERMLKEPGRSLDDIRAIQDDFKARADQRLGTGGRQTTPLDPNDPSGLDAGARTQESPRNMSVYAAP